MACSVKMLAAADQLSVDASILLENVIEQYEGDNSQGVRDEIRRLIHEIDEGARRLRQGLAGLAK